MSGATTAAVTNTVSAATVSVDKPTTANTAAANATSTDVTSMSTTETEARCLPFIKCVFKYDEAEKLVRDYEIENIVHFTGFKAHKNFNVNYEPWKHATGKRMPPKLLWGSDLVPHTGIPYIAISRKVCDCQYGKQRKPILGDRQKKTDKQSYKIGCPSTLEIAEILRLVFPRPRANADGIITKHLKAELAHDFQQRFKSVQDGKQVDLRFRREFHLKISPLASHNHVVGEAAAQHQRMDPLIVKRLHELAAAGITACDVVSDNIEYYVKEELFKGKTPPIKTNRRFYPLMRDIKNHVYLTKNQICKDTVNDDGVEESQVVSSAIDGSQILYGNNEEDKQERGSGKRRRRNSQSDGQYENETLQSIYQITNQQQPYQQQGRHYEFVVSEGSQYDQSTQQPYSQVSTYCSVSTETPPRKRLRRSLPPELSETHTTFGYVGYKKRTPKQKFRVLLTKMSKICETLEEDADFSVLSTLMVNVILKARTLLPQEKMEVVFQEDPRPLAAPRRIRKFRHRKPKDKIPRCPEINPNAMKLPDKKELRAEARRKAEELKEKRLAEAKAKDEAIKQKFYMEEKARMARLSSTPTMISSLDQKKHVMVDNSGKVTFDGKEIKIPPGLKLVKADELSSMLRKPQVLYIHPNNLVVSPQTSQSTIDLPTKPVIPKSLLLDSSHVVSILPKPTMPSDTAKSAAAAVSTLIPASVTTSASATTLIPATIPASTTIPASATASASGTTSASAITPAAATIPASGATPVKTLALKPMTLYQPPKPAIIKPTSGGVKAGESSSSIIATPLKGVQVALPTRYVKLACKPNNKEKEVEILSSKDPVTGQVILSIENL